MPWLGMVRRDLPRDVCMTVPTNTRFMYAGNAGLSRRIMKNGVFTFVRRVTIGRTLRWFRYRMRVSCSFKSWRR